MIPLASKTAKAAKKPSQARTIFRIFASGIKTNRDEWVYDRDPDVLGEKVNFFLKKLAAYSRGEGDSKYDPSIKWSRDLKRKASKAIASSDLHGHAVVSQWCPFVRQIYWSNKILSDILTEYHFQFFGKGLTVRNPIISFLCVHSSNPLAVMAVTGPFDYCLLKRGNGGTESVPLWTFDANGTRHENITDWAFDLFKKRYQPRREKQSRPVTKEAIFHYVYGVLHDPVYVAKYALNLRREFPRIPFYDDFWQWADWGKELMDLHIGYEEVEPFKLKRIDQIDEKSRKAGVAPKAMLKADKEAGVIVIDSETTISAFPREVWTYTLGNRSALEWILDQYKEKKPKDPTIREKFDTYRFADYKEQVVDLLMRVTTVSVRTSSIVNSMKRATR